MSTATVAPTAITEQRDGQTIEVTFSGRFEFGSYRWAYLPFDVPAGVRENRGTTSPQGLPLGSVGGNVLDLGIFGPAGLGVPDHHQVAFLLGIGYPADRPL